MADFTFKMTTTEDGAVQQTRAGERSVVLFTPARLSDHTNVGPQFTALRDAVAVGAEELSRRAPDLTTTGFVKAANALVADKIGPAFRATQAAVPAALANLERREAPMLRLYFPDEQPPAVRVEQRQYARSLALPTLIQATRNDTALAAAVIEGGAAMSGLPGDIFEKLRDDLRVANATRILSGQNQYLTEPSAADPIGGAPDTAKARAAGERLIAAFDAERALLARAPETLTAVVMTVALMTDSTTDAAFAALTAR